jgi:hypothetical protein
MDIQKAYKILSDKSLANLSKFYGNHTHLGIGAGLIYDGIRYPVFNPENNLFQTRRGKALILTHECDIAQDNPRPFNQDVLICPIILLENFLSIYKNEPNAGDLGAYLHNISTRKVLRLMYMPHIADVMPYGGILYFNLITSTRIEAVNLPEAKSIAAVSAYGLEEIDMYLKNLLFREKADRLSFSIH